MAVSLDKYGQRVVRRASATIVGEREAKQLLLKPVVVCLEKSRMCHNKYTLLVLATLLCVLTYMCPFGRWGTQ